MQSAAFESTYPVLSGFKWQRIYHAMTAGPITPAQVAVAHLSWVSIKLAGSGAIYVVVIAAVRRRGRPGDRGLAGGRRAHRRRGRGR